jgi:CheY-like chemotaxis protein
MAKEILIADSDKVDQKEFQRIFETKGYHLIFSESGEDALLRAKLFKPDMIIASGAGLQEKGGLELCGAMKGDPDFERIPFILISSIFDEISEKDRKRFQADGVISKPLNEGEVLDLVGNLMGEEAVGKRGEMASEKQEFLLDEMGEGEEEIIELMDVVEEPEPRMSIDSFVPTEREESFRDVASLDTWEKLEFEEKPVEKELGLPSEKKVGGMDLRLKRKVSLKEASPEEELFDKIELEEILEKVEQLKPSLDKEWPPEKQVGATEKEVRATGERPFQMEEPGEKLDLSEFETAFRKEIKAAVPREEPRPFSIEEPKRKISEETISREEPVEVEEIKELPEEEFPEELLEEILEEEEIGVVGKPGEMEPEEIRAEQIVDIEQIEEMVGMEQIDQIEEKEEVEELEEIKVDRLEEVEAPKITREEVSPLVKGVDQQMQEIISQKVQEMMGEMITKLVPEMTQTVVGFTLERIEKMVKEVVPDLAEKAIQEEIKRLQKGEKE